MRRDPGAGRRSATPATRLTRRGVGVLAGVVAATLVAVGAYAVPRLTPAHDAALTAVPGPSVRAPAGLDATPAPRPAGAGKQQGATGSASTKAGGSTSGVKNGSSKSGSTSSGQTRVHVPATGPGRYAVAREREAPATDRGRLYRFDVRVEKNLDIDPDQAALAIAKTLNDKRSWRGTGRWRFQLVAAGETADLHAYLVTPGTTDKLCAPLLTRGEVSCESGTRVVLNAKRWLRGADAYGDDVAGYRQYLVNHEFGHALGHGHLRCTKQGTPAPVMLQQTKGLQGCTKNPWPMTTGD